MTDIKERIQNVATEITAVARSQLEDEGYFDPVCICLYEENRQEFLYPRFKNESQRQEVFHAVNQHLRQSNAIGCVLVQEVWFTPKTTTGPAPPTDALLVLQRAPGVKTLRAYLFSGNGKKIEWGDEFEEQDFRDTMITAWKSGWA